MKDSEFVSSIKLSNSHRLIDDEIILFHYLIPEDINNQIILSLISTFSVADQNYFNSIQNKEAQKRTLFGRTILSSVAKQFDINEPDFLSFTSSGKPEFKTPSRYNFNISHSGNRVVCCVTKDTQIGIDLELIRPVDLEIYKNYFDFYEWEFILNSENPEIEFLKLWVRKEAVIKADGKGLEIDLHSINCLKNSTKTESNTWHIQDVEILPDYVCAVACNKYKNLLLLNFDTVFEMGNSNFFKVN